MTRQSELATVGGALRSNRFFRFLVVGGVNTAFGYGAFLLLLQLPMPLWLVVLAANVLAVLFNFQTTGKLVFENRDRRLIYRFVAAYTVMYFINLGSLKALIALGLPVIPASALLLLPMAVVSFLINRTFVFRESA